MTFRQLAKNLDKNAIAFANRGNLAHAFAAMEVAAYIRRKPKSFLRLRVETKGENQIG